MALAAHSPAACAAATAASVPYLLPRVDSNHGPIAYRDPQLLLGPGLSLHPKNRGPEANGVLT